MESKPVKIQIVDYDPQWPTLFQREAEKIRSALGSRVHAVEHAGSTSVPGLPAKPIVDIVLTVSSSAEEGEYGPSLQGIGYVLRVREPNWYEHRMLWSENEVNLHVFSAGCPEINRMLLFRDWLRANPADRDLYARTKLALAERQWRDVQEYADAKAHFVNEIVERALVYASQMSPS